MLSFALSLVVAVICFSAASSFVASAIGGAVVSLKHSDSFGSLSNIVSRTGRLSPTCATVSSETIQHSTHLLANKIFHLTEMIDDEVVESIVRMCPTGEIAFLSMDQPDDFKSIRGSWIETRNGLNMVVERTLMGRLSAYTVTSRYVTSRVERSNRLLSLSGDIFEEDTDGEFRVVTGQFMATTSVDPVDSGSTYGDSSQSNLMDSALRNSQNKKRSKSKRLIVDASGVPILL